MDDFPQRIATLFKQGDTITSADEGFPMLAKKGTTFEWLEIDSSSGGLKVDIVDATGISVDNVKVYGWDGSAWQKLSTDSSGQLQTAHDANTNPLFAKITDGSRELSIDLNGYAEVSVKSITAGTNTIGKVYLTDGTSDVDVNTDGSINVINSKKDSVFAYGSSNLVKDTPATVVTYTPGSTKKVIGVQVSGFGYCEWAIKFGTTGAESTIMVVQTTPSKCNEYVPFPEAIDVESTETILVEGTNRENKSSPGSDFTGHATIIHVA